MKIKDVPQECSDCEYLKVWDMKMDGNHGVVCRNSKAKIGHQFDADQHPCKYYIKYKPEE